MASRTENESCDERSNITRAERKVHLTLKWVYILPKEGWSDVVVSRYAEPYQPTSSKESKTVVIVGIAVAERAQADSQQDNWY